MTDPFETVAFLASSENRVRLIKTIAEGPRTRANVMEDYEATANWEETPIREAANIIVVQDGNANRRLAKATDDARSAWDKVQTQRGVMRDNRFIKYPRGSFRAYKTSPWLYREKSMLKASVKSFGKAFLLDKAFKAGAFVGAAANPFRDYSLGDLVGDTLYEAINGPRQTLNCDVAQKRC